MFFFKTFVENKFENLKERWASSRKFLRTETSTLFNNSRTSGSQSQNKLKIIKHDQQNDIHDLNDNNRNYNNPDSYFDFLDGEEKEQICVLLQNINIFRKKFNFNIFVKNAENKSIDKPDNKSNKISHSNFSASDNNKDKSETEKSSKLITRNAYSSVNKSNINNTEKDFEINNNNNKNAKITSSHFPFLNSIENKNNSLNNNKTDTNFFTNDSNSNLLWRTNESNNIYNNKKTTILTGSNKNNNFTEKEKPENNNNYYNNIHKNFITTENNEEKKNYTSTTNDFLLEDTRRIKSQEKFYKTKENHSIKESIDGLTTEAKNVFTHITNEVSENYSELKSFKNINNNNNLKDKFKISYEITVADALETKASIKSDNYKNKDYLKSLTSFNNIIFLNNGTVLNTKLDQKEKSSKIHFSNFNAFSILNTNINNMTRLATSYDTRNPNFILNSKENNNYNHNKNDIFGYQKKFINENDSSSNKIITDNSSMINLNNFNWLKNKTLKVNNKLGDSEKNTAAEPISAGGMVGKEGNLKFYLTLMEKYLTFKDKKASESLDSIDHYKKIIKAKIEKENIVRKEYLIFTLLI